MDKYNIIGMSCAACQAHVEKAVSKVPGVESVSVSLLTNSMGVEGSASSEAIVKAVEDAGYGAVVQGVEESQSSTNSLEAQEKALEDKESPVLKRRLVTSVVFLLVLMYFSMGHTMFHLPLPKSHRDHCYTDGSGGNSYVYQQEVLCRRMEKRALRCAKHGYIGCDGFYDIVSMELLYTDADDQKCD